MTVDNNEYVFVCGEIGESIRFGDTIISNVYDDQNPFVAQLNKSGDWLWAKTGGSPSPNERANSVVVDHLGNSYIVGYYEGSANFDGFNITSQGKKDIFIWKIDQYIEPVPPVVDVDDDDDDEIPIIVTGVHVPMAFSPNGDGNNDFLFVYGDEIKGLEFDIYDRWGSLVYHSTEKSKGWDGNFDGNKASSGVYFYKVKVIYSNGKSDKTAGDITLVR